MATENESILLRVLDAAAFRTTTQPFSPGTDAGDAAWAALWAQGSAAFTAVTRECLCTAPEEVSSLLVTWLVSREKTFGALCQQHMWDRQGRSAARALKGATPAAAALSVSECAEMFADIMTEAAMAASWPSSELAVCTENLLRWCEVVEAEAEAAIPSTTRSSASELTLRQSSRGRKISNIIGGAKRHRDIAQPIPARGTALDAETVLGRYRYPSTAAAPPITVGAVLDDPEPAAITWFADADDTEVAAAKMASLMHSSLRAAFRDGDRSAACVTFVASDRSSSQTGFVFDHSSATLHRFTRSDSASLPITADVNPLLVEKTWAVACNTSTAQEELTCMCES